MTCGTLSSTTRLHIQFDKTILVNSEQVALADLSAHLNDLPAEQRQEVSVRVDDEAPMGFVSNVQDEIRSAETARISYASR